MLCMEMCNQKMYMEVRKRSAEMYGEDDAASSLI